MEARSLTAKPAKGSSSGFVEACKNGITLHALAVSIEQELARTPLYRNAMSNGWNGEGERPDRLQAARHAASIATSFLSRQARTGTIRAYVF
jgi:hypothetical protein